MAYMSQEKKAGIAAELKKVMPKDWKWSLGVRHHSTIVLNIWSAPVDLVGIVNATRKAEYERHFGDTFKPESYIQLNQYYLSKEFAGDEKIAKLFEQISTALNRGNHDRSDSMIDHFDVGWYVDINLGKWDKPFQYKPKSEAEKELDAYWAGSVSACIAESYAKGDYKKVVVGEAPKPEGVTLGELVKQLWAKACEEDGIPADSKFVAFGESNKYAKLYNEAMLLVSKAAQ